MSSGYVRLANKTLVAVTRGRSLRIATVTDHDLLPVADPGIGRVRYYIEPATIRDGKLVRLSMFHGLWVKATKVTEVSVERAAELLAKSEAKEWS